MADAWTAMAALLLGYLLGSLPFALALAAGVAAVLGHSFSFWIGFKGGEGVLAGFGVFLALVPVESLLAVALPVLIFVAAPAPGYA